MHLFLTIFIKYEDNIQSFFFFFSSGFQSHLEFCEPQKERTGSDVDLCARLEICLQIYVGADFSHWSLHVLVYPSFHLVITIINIFF